MNQYKVQCPGCDALYNVATDEQATRLIHPGVDLAGRILKALPTKLCVASYNYVLFKACNHCCPETFGQCPECITNPVGTPSNVPCRCL
jgi:hypothetical protein